MAPKVLPVDLDDAIRLYESGESLEKVASEIGVSRATLIRRMKAAGYEPRTLKESNVLRHRRNDPDLTEAFRRYEAGEGSGALAKEFRIHQRRFVMLLREAGITPRSMSQAVGLRYAKMTVAERADVTATANAARRGRPASVASLERRARTMEATLQLASRADLALAVWMAQRGTDFTIQKAVGIYNVDIAVHEPAVAVEVIGASKALRHASRNSSTPAQRRNYLFDRGWRLIDVDITEEWLRPACADRVISLLEEARGDEPSWGQHCVIRGDGEDLPGREDDADDVA